MSTSMSSSMLGQTDGVNAEVSGDRAGRGGAVEGVIRRRFLRRLAGVVPGTRIGRVRWPRPRPVHWWPWTWTWLDGAGGPGRARAAGNGPGDPAAVPMPEPGEPPLARPTSAAPNQIEFVPQEPTRWLVPKCWC
jgi:hypothetical protein